MKDIKFLVMDVDGTLTDGKIYMSGTGEAVKAFDVKDGCGIHDIAIPAGITPIIITGRSSKILENRCNELGIREVYQGVSNKLDQLNRIVNNLSLVAYIGDDINDLMCMQAVKNMGGIVACPADAVKNIFNIADYVCKKNGGAGAVREFIDWLVED